MGINHIQEVALIIWASLQQQSSRKPVASTPNANAIDFLRARLILSICRKLQSIKEIEQYLSRKENRVASEWALNRMKVGDLESILALSSAND